MAKTIQEVVSYWRANPVTESSIEVDPLEALSARMPGDEPHPLKAATNPMPELGGPLALARALHAGKIPFDKERDVRRYIDQYQRMTGEVLYNPSNHDPV